MTHRANHKRAWMSSFMFDKTSAVKKLLNLIKMFKMWSKAEIKITLLLFWKTLLVLWFKSYPTYFILFQSNPALIKTITLSLRVVL